MSRVVVLVPGGIALWVCVALAQQGAGPDARGQQIVQAACAGCHELEVISRAKKSLSQWEETVADMVRRGAPLIDGERPILLQFLAKSYGPEAVTPTTTTQASAQPAVSMPEASGPDAHGRQILQEVCSVCHALEFIYQSKRSPSEWEELVNDMLGRGATLLEGEREILLQFLAKYYAPENPKTNINQASLGQLMTTFGLSRAEAEALGRFKQQNGTILGWEDLRKIPSLDLQKFETKRDLVAFF